MSADPFDTLVFTGGSERVIATLGVLQELPAARWAGCRTIVGTSAGALLAMMVATRLPHERCVRLVRQHFGEDAREDVVEPPGDVILGALDGRRCAVGNFVRAVLFEAMGKVNCSLEEFVKHTGVDLLIPVCSVLDASTDFLSVQSTPEVDMVTAVCMTTCVPFLFQPVRYGGKLYVDGATFGEVMRPSDFASHSKLQPHRVLLVYLKSSLPEETQRPDAPQGLLDLATLLVQGMMHRRNEALAQAARQDPRVTCVEVCMGTTLAERVRSGRPLLHVSDAEVEELLQAGRLAAGAAFPSGTAACEPGTEAR